MTNPWLDQVSDRHTITKLLLIGWVTTIVVATQQWAFVVDPNEYTTSSMKFGMYAYWAGWILLAAGTQLLALRQVWGISPTWKLLLIVGLVRPASIIFIHFQLYSQTGVWYFNYLTSQPIFLLTDVALPSLLIYFAWRERDNLKLLANPKTSDSTKQEVGIE